MPSFSPSQTYSRGTCLISPTDNAFILAHRRGCLDLIYICQCNTNCFQHNMSCHWQDLRWRFWLLLWCVHVYSCEFALHQGPVIQYSLADCDRIAVANIAMLMKNVRKSRNPRGWHVSRVSHVSTLVLTMLLMSHNSQLIAEFAQYTLGQFSLALEIPLHSKTRSIHTRIYFARTITSGHTFRLRLSPHCY